MAVCTHCHQVTALLLNPFDYFLGRIPVGKLRLGRDASRLKNLANSLQVCRVLGNLGAYCIWPMGSGCPACRHMEQHEVTTRKLREVLDMFDDCQISQCAV